MAAQSSFPRGHDIFCNSGIVYLDRYMSNKTDKLSKRSILRTPMRIVRQRHKNKTNNKTNNKINNKNKIIDSVWRHILLHNNIIDLHKIAHPIALAASTIRQSQLTWGGPQHQFEPRILCKHDCREDRPDLLAKHDLSIISISMREYMIVPTSGIFIDLPMAAAKPIKIAKNKNSLVLQMGKSETTIIDNLRHAGVLDQYLGEPILFDNLLGSRHRCTFDAQIDGMPVCVRGAQYEADAVFESQNKILLIEAKQRKNITNFNVRQLYYPFRAILDATNAQKEILCLFINHYGGKIDIWQIRFDDMMSMTSAKCEMANSYLLRE